MDAPAAATPCAEAAEVQPQVEAETIADTQTSLPRKTTLSFKPSYTFPNGSDRYKAELQFESILPYRGFWIPDLNVPGFWSIARVQLSAESTETENGTASGLGDLTLVDLVAHRAGPLNVGVGFATVFPMATSTALGQSKWQLGPALGFRIVGLSLVGISALVQNVYSVAGSSQSPAIAYVSVQPFFTVRLPEAFFLSTDATMYFYWAGGKSTVPVDLGFGRAFSEHFIGSLRGWYTLGGADKGAVKVQAVLGFIP